MISSSAECASDLSTARRSSSTEAVGLVGEGHAAEDDLRRDDRAAVLLRDGRDDDEDAVRRQHAAVAQGHVLDVAHLHPVHEDEPGLLALAPAGAGGVDLERASVLSAEDRLRRDPHGLGQLGVQAQPLVVAVHRHHVARLREVEHQLQLLGVAVAGGVHGHVGRGDHARAEPVDAVDRLVHRSLVAGDRRGREDHGVAVVQVHVRVIAVGHAAQRRERLALRPCRDDHELVVREVLDLLRAHQQTLRDVDVAEHAPDVRVLAHRAADQRDAPADRGRGIHHLLDPVDVRGEAGDDDAALAAGEHLHAGAAPRSTRTATRRGGRRSSSRRRGAAAARGPARRASRRRRARRPPASGRTCSRRSSASCRAPW